MKSFKHKVLIEIDGKIVVQCNEEKNTFDVIQFLDNLQEYRNWLEKHQFFDIADKENEDRIKKLIYEEKQNLDGEYYNYHKFNKALKQGIDVSDFVVIKQTETSISTSLKSTEVYKAFFKSPSEDKPSDEKEEGHDWDSLLKEAVEHGYYTQKGLIRFLKLRYNPPTKKTKI